MKTLLKLRFFIPWLPLLGLLYVVVACDVLRKIDYRASLPLPAREQFSYKQFIFGAPADSVLLYWWLVWQIAIFSAIINIPI